MQTISKFSYIYDDIILVPEQKKEEKTSHKLRLQYSFDNTASGNFKHVGSNAFDDVFKEI